jgi:hypothetical protein
MKNSYIFVWIHQICKVQAVNDGPLILDLEIVILEVVRDILSHARAIKIEQQESTIIVKICNIKGNHESQEVWNVAILMRNLSRRIRNTRHSQSIRILHNNGVHYRLLLELTSEIHVLAFTKL